jgi:hypothetical protein
MPKTAVMSLHRVVYCAIILFLLAFGIYSCQKEPNAKLDDTKDISSKDPDALSSAIKVWHGVRTMGNVPAERGNALQLDNSTTDPLHAITGRYAIIQPQVISGDVSGYYLKINGASDYFKVDYTKPRNVGRQMKHRNNAFLRMDSLGGNLDSAIVVVLPSDLHVPDTICMTYWAYDNSGNVSNPVDVCIIISSLGTDTNGAWLNGTWRITAAWDNNGAYDTTIYDRWSGSTYVGYHCNNGVLQYSNTGNFLVTDSTLYHKVDLIFGSNGGLNYSYDISWKYVLDFNSTCSNFQFGEQHDAQTIKGAWSYNSTTHKLIIVFEFEDTGVPIEEASEYNLIQVNSKNAILADITNPSYPNYIRMEKF